MLEAYTAGPSNAVLPTITEITVIQTAIERSIPAMRKTETRLDAMLYSSGFTELMMVVVFGAEKRETPNAVKT